MKKLISILFKFPYLYDRFLDFFIDGWPIETVLLFFSLTYMLYVSITSRNMGTYFCLVAFITSLFSICFVRQDDDTIRYVFHLYPMIIIIISCFLVFVLEEAYKYKTALIGIIFILLVFSPFTDFSLTNSFGINRRGYGESINQPLKTPDSGRGHIFYPDYKTTSQYIAANLENEDIFVSMLEVIPFSYIGRMDYVWLPRENEGRPIGTPGTGAVPRIDSNQFKQLLSGRNAKRLWLLKDPYRVRRLINDDNLITLLSSLDSSIVYRGLDKETTVYLIPPRAK